MGRERGREERDRERERLHKPSGEVTGNGEYFPLENRAHGSSLEVARPSQPPLMARHARPPATDRPSAVRQYPPISRINPRERSPEMRDTRSIYYVIRREEAAA